jgi:hypothetical protein
MEEPVEVELAQVRRARDLGDRHRLVEVIGDEAEGSFDLGSRARVPRGESAGARGPGTEALGSRDENTMMRGRRLGVEDRALTGGARPPGDRCARSIDSRR